MKQSTFCKVLRHVTISAPCTVRQCMFIQQDPNQVTINQFPDYGKEIFHHYMPSLLETTCWIICSYNPYLKNMRSLTWVTVYLCRVKLKLGPRACTLDMSMQRRLPSAKAIHLQGKINLLSSFKATPVIPCFGGRSMIDLKISSLNVRDDFWNNVIPDMFLFILQLPGPVLLKYLQWLAIQQAY